MGASKLTETLGRLRHVGLGIVVATAADHALAVDPSALQVYGGDYYSPGERLPDGNTLQACQIPEAALGSYQDFRNWFYPHPFIPGTTAADEIAATLLWESHNVLLYKEKSLTLSTAFEVCSELGDDWYGQPRCVPFPKDHAKQFSADMKAVKGGKSSYYYKHHAKKKGFKPQDRITALRYLAFGGCAIPKRVNWETQFGDLTFGTFSEDVCQQAARMSAPADEPEHVSALFKTTLGARQRYSGRMTPGPSCFALPTLRHDALLASGSLEAGAAERKVAREAERDAEFAALVENRRRARDSWRKANQGYGLLDVGQVRCTEAADYARAAQSWTGAALERNWWLYYTRDSEGACSMVPQQFFTGRKIKRPDPVGPAGTTGENGNTLQDALDALNDESARRATCIREGRQTTAQCYN